MFLVRSFFPVKLDFPSSFWTCELSEVSPTFSVFLAAQQSGIVIWRIIFNLGLFNLELLVTRFHCSQRCPDTFLASALCCPHVSLVRCDEEWEQMQISYLTMSCWCNWTCYWRRRFISTCAIALKRWTNSRVELTPEYRLRVDPSSTYCITCTCKCTCCWRKSDPYLWFRPYQHQLH